MSVESSSLIDMLNLPIVTKTVIGYKVTKTVILKQLQLILKS